MGLSKNIMQSIRNILGSAENSAHHRWFYESTYCDMHQNIFFGGLFFDLK